MTRKNLKPQPSNLLHLITLKASLKLPKPVQRAIKHWNDWTTSLSQSQRYWCSHHEQINYVNSLGQASISDTSNFPLSAWRDQKQEADQLNINIPFAEGKTCQIRSMEDFAKANCRLCLPGGLTPSPSLWTPKDVQRETINVTYPICHWYLQLCPCQVTGWKTEAPVIQSLYNNRYLLFHWRDSKPCHWWE